MSSWPAVSALDAGTQTFPVLYYGADYASTFDEKTSLTLPLRWMNFERHRKHGLAAEEGLQAFFGIRTAGQ
jgi:hypothetical protein